MKIKVYAVQDKREGLVDMRLLNTFVTDNPARAAQEYKEDAKPGEHIRWQECR